MIQKILTTARNLGWTADYQTDEHGLLAFIFKALSGKGTQFQVTVATEPNDWKILDNNFREIAEELPEEDYPEVFDIRNEKNERWTPQSQEDYEDVIDDISAQVEDLYWNINTVLDLD